MQLVKEMPLASLSQIKERTDTHCHIMIGNLLRL